MRQYVGRFLGMLLLIGGMISGICMGQTMALDLQLDGEIMRGNGVTEVEELRFRVRAGRVDSTNPRRIGYVIDNKGRVTEQRQYEYEGDAEVVRQYAYNNRGDISRYSSLTPDCDGRMIDVEWSYRYRGDLMLEKSNNREPKQILYTYKRKRLIKEVTQDSSGRKTWGTRHYVYNTEGQLMMERYESDTYLEKLLSLYDEFGNRIEYKEIAFRQFFGETKVVVKRWERYIYDSSQRLIGRIILDEEGNPFDAVLFMYDGKGRLSREVFSGHELVYSYDEDDNLLEVLKRNKVGVVMGLTVYRYQFKG